MTNHLPDEPWPQSISSPADLGLAIAASEYRIMRALNAGLQQVTAAIANLTEMHHKALLEQERRNATFATSDRLERVARRVDDLTTQLAARSQHFESIEASVTRIDKALTDLESRVDTRSFSFISSVAGYLVMALLTSGATVLAFVLAHAVH